MADKKEETKKSPLATFREKLADKAALQANIEEGLKHTNAKVRAFAAKLAVKTQDSKFVKKNVMPLVKSEKTKRVLGRIQKKFDRSDIKKRIEEIAKMKPAAKKEAAAPAEGEAK